jgi:hypothetical protein
MVGIVYEGDQVSSPIDRLVIADVMCTVRLGGERDINRNSET